MMSLMGVCMSVRAISERADHQPTTNHLALAQNTEGVADIRTVVASVETGMASQCACAARSVICPSNCALRWQWDENNVLYWLSLSGAQLNRHALGMTSVISKAAVAADIPAVSNLSDFVRALYYLPFSNDMHFGLSCSIVGSMTNAELAGVLFDMWTNDYGKECRMPESRFVITRRSPLHALRKIGTPEVIDRLNHAWLTLHGSALPYSGPGETIAPDVYPQEARDWLFNYPILSVRDAMVSVWYHSQRPETPDLLRAYARRLRATPVDNLYWGTTNHSVRDPFGNLPAARTDDKRARIREINDYADMFERQYGRWLKDKQRLPLHYGCYRDGNWDEYRHLSEKERRDRYGAQYGSSNLIR